MTPAAPEPRYRAEEFINRELSHLAFNRRVLARVADDGVPLLERLRYACIVSSNLDEFFEVRVAALKEQIRFGASPAADGLTPQETFRRVSDEVHQIIAEQYGLLYDTLLPALARHGIVFLRRDQWNDHQKAWIRDYFLREFVPVITPIGLDPSHPFPRVLNKILNFAVELEGRDAFGRSSGAAIVQAPRALPRVVRLPRGLGAEPDAFVFLSSILHAHVGELFSGMNVLGCYQFRVTRNSDLWVDDEETKDLRVTLQGELPQRHFGDAVRLEVADTCSEAMAKFLMRQFDLAPHDLYRVPGVVNMVRLMDVPDWVDRPDLKFPPFVPGKAKPLAKERNIFDAISRGDILLHHPYQSFAPVIDLLEQSIDDPAVVAIKMTVYRTGTDSVLMQSLVRAAQQGKEVTVVVELLARFDEEANINIAQRLEEVGAHVIYGVFGYKTHAKMLLIVRREGSALKRYVHLGTGNYHPRTARLYTDFGLLTTNADIAEDVSEVFKTLTGLGKAKPLRHLWQAPFTLHANIIAAIRREAEHARGGRRAQIIAKMNALVEPQVIEALYEASRAGVQIDLIVRGVCALRPQVKGLSENIRCRAIVGRFLEHSRIYYFLDDGEERVYLSSADWMERNFFRRIELCFPVLDPVLRKRVVREGLKPYLRDNAQSWELSGDSVYRPRGRRGKRYCAQEALLTELAGKD